MNTENITKHLNQMRSTAEGIAAVTWSVQFRVVGQHDTRCLPADIEYMTTALENLQAAFDDLKRETEVQS